MIPKIGDVVYLKSGSPALTVVHLDEPKNGHTWVSVTWSCDSGCDREHLRGRGNRTAFRSEVFTGSVTPGGLSKGSVVKSVDGSTGTVERLYNTDADVVRFDGEKQYRETRSLNGLELVS